MQPAIADLTHLHYIGIEIVSERAGTTVNLHSITRRQRIDTAKLQYSFGAIIESAKDGQQIWNDDFVAIADWVNDFSAREDTVDLAKPALQHFDVNPECEHVEPADFDPLPPMRRSGRIQIIAGKTLQSHMVRTADITFSQELFHEQIGPHSHRRRTKHRHQLWITL